MTDNDTTSPDAPPKRGRGRPKGQPDETRRQAIINEAFRAFVELGLGGTTTDIVASRCRISKQTLYRFFPSKTDLFAAVVASHRRMMLRLPRPPHEDAPLEHVIADIFMIDIDEETERTRESFIRMVMRESHQQPELGAVLFREGPETSRLDLATWLETQIANGKLRPVNPATMARILMDLLFGGVGPGPKGWKDLAERREHLKEAIAIFLQGAAA